jgi:hypothetical protein
MTKIIPTKFPNTRCRACGRFIPQGENVRWTKGEKGVTCVTCPGQTVHATTGAPVANETAWESLSRRFNIVQAEANMLRAQRDELQRHATELEAQVIDLLDSLQRLRLFQAAHTPATEQPEITDVLADPDLINVMAPGGVEAWLEADKAVRAANQLSSAALVEAATNALDTDDDCPI